MNLLEDARAIGPELVGLRRRLHREPEVGLELPRTQEKVLEALAGLPLEITLGRATTSVAAVLRGARRNAEAPATVLLRGDMDALPVAERSGEEFASDNGAMHACGHDLHTASLVGAARLLSAQRDRLAGDVLFMFQPGEEGCDGAGVMLSEGLLDVSGRRPDYAYALHVIANRMPFGLVYGRPGIAMAAAYGLHVTVRGAGGHGAMPHDARDPVVAAAEMVGTLQTAVTRSFDVFSPVVVSVGMLHAGTLRNIIPDTASFEATVRAFAPDLEDRLREVLTRCVRGIAEAHRVEVDVELRPEYPALVNDASETEFAAGVARELLGPQVYHEAPNPIPASEDFSRVLGEVPGAMLMVGACSPGSDPSSAPANHSPLARFDDSVLPKSAGLLAGFAATRLTR